MKQLATIFSFTLLLLLLTAPAQAQTTRFGTAPAQGGFGRAVAVHDGTVFVGESRNAHTPGKVYIYRKNEGEWTERTQLAASDGAVGDRFGDALAVNGEMLLVGADAQGDRRGAAYLYQRTDGGNWSEVTQLAPPDSVEGSHFGGSVALGENVALVGAPAHHDNAGAVYVFQRDASGMWTRRAVLTGSDTRSGDRFGSTIAIEDEVALIAAQKSGGAVYVFQRDASGMWTEGAKLRANQLSSSASFGATVDVAGNYALIGAPRHDGGLGTVLTFERDPASGTWSQAGRLAAFDGQKGDLFGASLAFDGSEAWIGAPGVSDGAGTLYLFKNDPSVGTWLSVKKVTGPKVKQGDRFGSTLAADGDVAVAGNVGADFGAGTVTIFERDLEAKAWMAQTTVLSGSGTGLDAITGGQVDCTDGKAAAFDCKRMDLVSFLPIDKIGGKRGVRVNDIWGWTDPETDREYAIVGRMDGTSFIDVTNPTNPVYVGNLPKHEGSASSIWRDIKVYENHAYVVADNAGDHGMQVFDLTQLRDFDGTPLTFEETAHYDRVNSAHNVVINTDTGFAYIVGSSGGGQTCGGGLHMVNIQNPTQPSFVGCFADPSTGRTGTGYTHDAQCVTYQGPDTEYQGREICIGANETAISIADVTDKENPKAISTGSYPDHAYVHQGWLSEDHRYFFQNDELDEINGSVDSTRTLIWDVSDLDDPQLVRQFLLSNPSTDHNLYVKEGTMYQSNYVSGLRVLDVSDPANPVEVGHFDTLPFGEDAPGFAGTWSNYPFFKSGIVVVASMQEGLFILKKAAPEM